VYVSPSAGLHDFTMPTIETAAGAKSATIGGLLEAKPYYVVVRAVDAAGNADANMVEVSGSTLDKTPPTFAGVGSVSVLGTSITLKWTAATDNFDPAAYLVYDIYQSKSSAFDFTTPTATTAFGATDYTFSGLDVSSMYHFVVRARDTSGNRDANTVDKTGVTAASPDVKAPTFGGLVSMTPLTDSTIQLDWSAAVDDYTAAASIAYDIYVGGGPSGEDFSAPSYTAVGTTSYTLSGLSPLTSYYAVVRARDTAGNRDTNAVERTAKTLADKIPPKFDGLASVKALGSTQLQLSWLPATDDVSSSGAIKYRIYQASATGGEVYTTPTITTTAGVTTYTIGSLKPDTAYYFVVRAVDEVGNADTNVIEKTAKTDPDKVPPVFGGLVSLTSLGPTSMLASWSPASDDTAAASTIVYDLFPASATGGETYSSPKWTTTPGQTSFTITGLSPKQLVYLVVRARDPYGNEDTNVVEKSATTDADKTPPVFGGATGISGATSTTLSVNWVAATDDVTAQSKIKYQICISKTATGCNGAGFTADATVTGLTTYQFTSLTPLTTYYVRVQAQDEAGLLDGNTKVVSGNTVNDSTPPTWPTTTGCTSATPAAGASGAAALVVSWNAATDNVSTPAQLVYDVWKSTTGAFNFAAAPDYSSAPGATSVTASGLLEHTKYFFTCRARDVANNRDSNVVQVSSTTTFDTTPPTATGGGAFGGATSVSALSDSSIQVFWSQGIDNTTAQANIRYLVCWWDSTMTPCTTTFTAMATVIGGSNYTASSLKPGTTYNFMVRARDTAITPNTDTNSTVKSVSTNADSTPPVFVGSLTVTPRYQDTVASAGYLDASWTAATDASSVRYQLCATTTISTTYAACASAGGTTFVTAYGATSYILFGLNPRTTYYVSVRAIDSLSNFESGSHYATATTATSYSSHVATIFSAAGSSGGCSGCHGWSRANTVNVASGCGGYNYVTPGSPTTSIIYRKMAGGAYLSSCPFGAQMPYGSSPNGTFVSQMYDWILQGAHNN
jgi:hypothetical protein